MMDYREESNIISPEETDKSLITNSKEMEIYKWSAKKTEIIILKKLSTIQENPNN